MKLLSSFFTCFLTVALLAAGKPEATAQVNQMVQVWNSGKVFLATGDTIPGKISYYLDAEVVKVDQPGQGTTTFSPVNITGFVVKDDNQLVYREFRTMLWHYKNQPGGFKRPVFFELLQEGKYSLMKRDIYKIVKNSGPSAVMAAGMPVPVPLPRESVYLVEMFYVLSPTGKIIQLKKPKKDMPYIYSDAALAKRMDAFINENNLSYHKTHDLKAIIRFYNSLL